MARKRKAGDDIAGTRHRAAARTEPTAGDDLAARSGQTAGRTADAAGDGIAGTSPVMAWLLAVTSGYAVGSSQFDGAAPVRGAGGGSGYRGFSQSQPRRREPQIPSQGMLRPPLRNPVGGRPPFTNQCHAPTGHGSLPGQTQNHVAGPRQTGTGQPRGHSGGGGPPTAITSGASVSPLSPVCTLCKRPTTGVWGLVPLCVDCYNNPVTSNVVQQHPEIRYVPPHPVPSYGGATQGQGIAIGHQHQPSYAGLARAAVGPLTRAPSADCCCVCLEPIMGALDSSPLVRLCVDCYNRLFVAGDAPPQHAQSGYVLPSPVPSYAGAPGGALPAGEQQYRAAAIRPPPSSTSSSAIGSGPICPACGHPSGSGNRACSVCHRNGPPPPELG
ncbi:hypothetical protein VPH35_093333 [Triticum aestivum]|uniref:uncharacterized protein isoform X2 n=1 Tax=Triticum aestivum TaxID=4565 RepID=UPI001D011FB2|nr:uncharacterized protein LOC123117299 isoform X2 [Triticum aestivum]